MAKRKKKRAKKAAAQPYIGMWSECGSLNQLAAMELYGNPVKGATVEAVKVGIREWIDSEGNMGGTFAVVQILDVGTPSEINWTGKTEL